MDPPEKFKCPISHELMQQPVVAADGHHYDRVSIENWLKDHSRSPLNGDELPHKFLNPDIALRSEIIEWCREHGVKELPPVRFELPANPVEKSLEYQLRDEIRHKIATGQITYRDFLFKVQALSTGPSPYIYAGFITLGEIRGAALRSLHRMVTDPSSTL